MGLLSGSPWQRWIWSVEVNGGENNDRYPSSHLPGIFFDGVYPFPVFLAASPRWFSLTTSSFTMTLQSTKKRHPQILFQATLACYIDSYSLTQYSCHCFGLETGGQPIHLASAVQPRGQSRIFPVNVSTKPRIDLNVCVCRVRNQRGHQTSDRGIETGFTLFDTTGYLYI